MRKRRAVSIKWKIFLFLLGFCTLLLVLLWLMQTVFLQSFYTAVKLSQVESEARSLAALLQRGETEALVESLRTRGDLLVELVDEQGNSQTYDGFFPEQALGVVDAGQKAELYARAVENGGELSVRHTLDAEMFGAAPPPQAPEGQQGGPQPREEQGPFARRDKGSGESVLHAVIVQVPGLGQRMLLVRALITPVGATVEALRIQLLYVSVVMVVLAVAIALLISRRVAKPIERLNTEAKRLGRGDYSVRFRGAATARLPSWPPRWTAPPRSFLKPKSCGATWWQM